jgi:adenine-specific DNA-methyltransferase
MEPFEKLTNKLSELFELEKADLDFGIHRIIKARQKHIRIFLGIDEAQASDPHAPTLRKIVQREMGELNVVELQRQLDATTEKIKSDYGKLAFTDAGILADGPAKESPDGQQWLNIKEELASGAEQSNAQLEAEIYSHLTEFFSRYYDQADFLSKRRIKAGDAPYAVPYSGEEVMLHWANKDQYYIKSSKDLKDYTFTLPEQFGQNKRVQFKCERQDPVLNNNNSKREFYLDDEAQIEATENTIVIPFHFKIVEKTRTAAQKESFIEEILAKLPIEWQSALKHKPNGAANDLITRHLANYTGKNESDFFIHKHLGRFLRGELDFYIKSEVMQLDDIDEKSTDYLATRVRLIKALRTIARHIITFLAQLENFQKKLWLKKKYVTETQYCITLDRIFITTKADALIATVLEHLDTKIRRYDGEMRSQHDELIKLYAIDELEDYPKNGKLTTDFLRAHDKLMLDTVFYPASFKWQLLTEIDDLESSLNGLIIHSENFQALNLLKERYRGGVKCVYIDPPYNTNSTPIIYKNGYKSSSWATLMNDRLELTKSYLPEDGVLCTAIDDAELDNLSLMLKQSFLSHKTTKVAITTNPKGSITKDFNRVHDYALFTVPREHKRIARSPEENDQPRKMRRWGENSLRTERPESFYPIFVKDMQVVGIGEKPDDSFHPDSKNQPQDDGSIAIWPIDQNGIERRWNFGLDSIKENLWRVTCIDVEGVIDLFLTHELTVPKTVWTGGDFDAGNHGNSLLIDIIGEKVFEFPKSIKTVESCINIANNAEKHGEVLDYFPGSGTTAHAIINLNREDSGHRKYILVEMGDHFDTVLKLRIQKVVYSKDWKEGKPTAPKTGISHAFKYLRLESYEDALNNLDLGTDRAPDLLGLGDQVREDYLFSYLLDVETRGHLMNLERFRNPWGCQLKIHDPHTGKSEPRAIDLVETFNYLLGITLREVRTRDGFLTIEGESPSGETILIIWRKIAGESDWPATTNADLQKFVTEKLRLNPADTEYHAIYLNGDHTLADPHSKIHCIEEVFYERMFENTGNPED